MQYPTLLEYMKAIQDAGNNLDNLSHLSVVLDGHGEPYHISGDSSVVFKMQDKTTGKCYALKCFTKAQKECADASSNSSSVKYLEKELLVQSQGKEEKYPVLLMDWVDVDSLGACQLKVEDMSTVATKAELNEVSSGAIGEFKSVVDTETETFNTNAESKLNAYNQNDSQKKTAYTTQPSKISIDLQNNKVSLKPFKVVSMTSWLAYGGYAARAMLTPSSYAPQEILLRGNRKEIKVVM